MSVAFANFCLFRKEERRRHNVNINTDACQIRLFIFNSCSERFMRASFHKEMTVMSGILRGKHRISIAAARSRWV